jgi:hypothetical protein
MNYAHAVLLVLVKNVFMHLIGSTCSGIIMSFFAVEHWSLIAACKLT